jgi:hypothetical protein
MWLVLLIASCSMAAPDAIVPLQRVRAATPAAQALVTEAVTRSATVNDLITRLGNTDAIVYVEITASPEIPLARTKLVFGTPDVRFLRVSINIRVPGWERVALLAHELQHAIEIGETTDVRDDDAVRRLYARIGFPGGVNRFETAAARETERRVRGELARKEPR